MCSFGMDGKFCSRNEEQWSVRRTEKHKKVLMGDMELDYFAKRENLILDAGNGAKKK